MPHSIFSKQPQHWTDLPNGEMLQSQVQSYLEQWWPKVFGYHLLKIGPLSAMLNSMACTISHQVSLSQQGEASIVGRTSQLPLLNCSVDAALMSLQLEFETNPYQVLREVDRVIISGGHLFIVGFNPMSAVFLGKCLPKYQHRLPWSGRFYTPARVKDWLSLLGYQVIADERMVFHSLLTETDFQSIWQHTLQAWLPSAGSVYILVARKLDSPLTPIREKRKIRRRDWSAAPSAGKLSKRPTP